MTTLMEMSALDQASFAHAVLDCEEPMLVLFGDG